MNRLLRGILVVGVLTLSQPNTVVADNQRDLASDARAVFAAKCAVCHGPDLAKPKGRFGYVTDLARVANNRELVVPSSPDESELWELVRRDEMPPADSPAGPLSTAQKEAIRAWIAAGAPATAAPDGPPADRVASVADDPMAASPSLPAPSLLRSLLGRLGPLHIPVVHFPIALLLAAAAAELLSVWRGHRLPSPAVNFCVRLGAVSAVVAAVLGWVHAGNDYGAGMPLALSWHRWLGTSTALWAIGTAWLADRD